MSIDVYNKKRDFSKTAEPKGATAKIKNKKSLFVVQHHYARKEHYDLRLEVDGVLKSWAVPKAPSMDPKDKRLAVMTEDHPLEYADFHGVIPYGEYGAGSMYLWDKGYFANLTIKDGRVEPLSKWIENGHIIFYLKGDRLCGSFALNKMEGKNWLLIKMKESEPEKTSPDIQMPVNQKKIAVTNPKKEIFANIDKEQFVTYHKKVAKLMLPLVKNRPLSLYRYPHGMREPGFYQKHSPKYFPDWIPTVDVTRKGKKIKFLMANSEESLVYLSTLICTFHMMPSTVDKLKFPDRMIFDLDPSVPDLDKLRQAAGNTKNLLNKLGMPTYLMTTGSNGYHIIVPLDRSTEQQDVHQFAKKIANVLCANSEIMTDEMRKEKREDKVFIDTYRNSITHTACAPYSVRDTLRGGIATPVDWKELKKVEPRSFTLENLDVRLKKNPWKNYGKETVSVEKLIKQLKQ